MHWGVLSTSLPRSRHVEVRLSRHYHVVHVEVRGFAPIDLKEFVLSKVFFLDGFVAPRFLNTVAERGPPRPGAALSPRCARDPGNKAADSAHVMGSGGLAVVAVAIGCLGAERRGERFFRTWTFFNRRPPTTQSEVGRSAAGHIRAIKGSDGVSPVGARQDQPHNESCARCWVRKHLRTSAVPCSVPGRKILWCRVILRHRAAWQRDGRVPRVVLWQF